MSTSDLKPKPELAQGRENTAPLRSWMLLQSEERAQRVMSKAKFGSCRHGKEFELDPEVLRSH